jgi:hypothetical protein
MRKIIDGDKRPRRNGQRGQIRKQFYAIWRSIRYMRRYSDIRLDVEGILRKKLEGVAYE